MVLSEGAAPASTLLSYSVDASVGGKLAQIGSRLIDGAARKMADDFFAEFGQLVGADQRSPDDLPITATEAQASIDEIATATDVTTSREQGPNWIIWLIVFAALAIALTAAL